MMSTTITVDESQTKLKELIHQISPGDELILTENRQPVARLDFGDVRSATS